MDLEHRPAPQPPGGNTWPWSGSAVPTTAAARCGRTRLIDAKDGLVIFGTGNPVPWNSRGPGANLFTDSIVALNVNTGAFKWAYQTVHHDLWDSDLPNGAVLFDMKVDGQDRAGRRRRGEVSAGRGS